MPMPPTPPQDRINDLIKLYTSGQTAMAAQTCKELLDSYPHSSILHNIYGAVLINQGKPQEAVDSINEAISLNADYAEAYNNRGNAFIALGNLNEALDSYNMSIQLKPESAGFHANRANTLHELGQLDESILSFDTAIQLKPDYAEAYTRRGHILKIQGRLTEAAESCDKAIRLRPDYAEAYTELGNVLLDLGEIDEADRCYRRALEIDDNNKTAISSLLFTLNYQPLLSPSEIYTQHVLLGNRLETLSTDVNLKSPSDRAVNARLRIGYISADFKIHSVAYFFEPLLMNHDRSQIETYCYYNDTIVDETTRRLTNASEHWRSIAKMNDEDVLTLIQQDNIDILVDLGGHTGKNRLSVFACKAAPVQVSWLGYPNTTGLRAIDYRFTDAAADPVGEADRLHSEQLVRLPKGFLCYQGDESASMNTALPCLERGAVTFGCFNNLNKVTPQVIEIWSRILQSIPGARLLLKSRQLAEPEVKARYLNMFKREGVSLERIDLYSRIASKEGHLELYNSIDIGLDPFPYNGTTTTCEALWMGVPVITLSGDRHAGRVGTSILTHAGLEEFIAHDLDEYTELAVSYSMNTDYLSDLRPRLREILRESDLCNAKGFSKSIEAAYKTMWDRYREDN